MGHEAKLALRKGALSCLSRPLSLSGLALVDTVQAAKVTPFAAGTKPLSEKGPQAAFSNELSAGIRLASLALQCASRSLLDLRWSCWAGRKSRAFCGR
jgi:hypothetical protein